MIVFRIVSFFCNQWLHLVVNHPRYLRFTHVVPVNSIRVIMRCLEIDVGKFRELHSICMVKTLHLIAALFRGCHEMKLVSEVAGDRPL